MFDGPTINICKGCDGNEHCFLAAEGVSLCNTCKAKSVFETRAIQSHSLMFLTRATSVF